MGGGRTQGYYLKGFSFPTPGLGSGFEFGGPVVIYIYTPMVVFCFFFWGGGGGCIRITDKKLETINPFPI